MVHTSIHSIYINRDRFYSNFIYLTFWKILSKFRYADIMNILGVTNSGRRSKFVKAAYLFPYLSSRDQLSNASSLRERNNIQTSQYTGSQERNRVPLVSTASKFSGKPACWRVAETRSFPFPVPSRNRNIDWSFNIHLSYGCRVHLGCRHGNIKGSCNDRQITRRGQRGSEGNGGITRDQRGLSRKDRRRRAAEGGGPQERGRRESKGKERSKEMLVTSYILHLRARGSCTLSHSTYAFFSASLGSLRSTPVFHPLRRFRVVFSAAAANRPPPQPCHGRQREKQKTIVPAGEKGGRTSHREGMCLLRA